MNSEICEIFEWPELTGDKLSLRISVVLTCIQTTQVPKLAAIEFSHNCNSACKKIHRNSFEVLLHLTQGSLRRLFTVFSTCFDQVLVGL